MMDTEKYCWCGESCIDGTCPAANRDEYAERGYDVVHSCADCWEERRCDTCCFEGTSDCPKVIE